VVDTSPIKLGAKIAFHIGHKVAGKSVQIRHLGGIVGRHNEAKMVPIALASLCERRRVHVIVCGTEHVRETAVLRNAVALQVAEMRRQWRRL
jgi:hypothetical protein